MPSKTSSLDAFASSKTTVDMMDKVSSTSTVMYDQEPFSTFHDKVAQLCVAQFGLRSIKLERMTGGAFNRVVGMAVGPPPAPPKQWPFAWFKSLFQRLRLQSWVQSLISRFKKKKPAKYGELKPLPGKGRAVDTDLMKYVLRVPRFDDGNSYSLEHDVAVLRFARAQLDAPIPDVIHFDPTSDNAIESSYTIQERLPGQNLHELWKTLSHAQHLCFMRWIVHFTTKMKSITNDTAGAIAPRNIPSAAFNFQLDGLANELRFKRNIPLTTAPPQSTFELLLHLCDAQIGDQASGKHSSFVMPIWYKLRKVIHALHDLGFLPDTDKFHFCHLDLYPRNILVELPDQETVNITGLLDWDAQWAYFCPKFVAFCAPCWVWNEHDDDEDEDDESLATAERGSEHQKQLKNLFEELADDEWKRYAFAPEYILARRMYRVLRLGYKSAADMREADAVVSAWRELHHDDDLRSKYEMTGADSGFFYDSEAENSDEETSLEEDSDSDEEADENEQNMPVDSHITGTNLHSAWVQNLPREQ